MVEETRVHVENHGGMVDSSFLDHFSMVFYMYSSFLDHSSMVFYMYTSFLDHSSMVFYMYSSFLDHFEKWSRKLEYM
jgi:hypothetical protein